VLLLDAVKCDKDRVIRVVNFTVPYISLLIEIVTFFFSRIHILTVTTPTR